MRKNRKFIQVLNKIFKLRKAENYEKAAKAFGRALKKNPTNMQYVKEK